MSQKAQQLFQKAITAHQKGDLANAKKSYEKLLKLAPKHPIALHNLAAIYQTQNNFIEAEKLYKKAIYNKSDYFSAYRNLANLYLSGQQPVNAKIYYQKALQLNPNAADVYNHLATIYDEESQFDKAIECYKKSIRLNSKDPKVYNNLGTLYENKKDFLQAEKLFIQAIQLNNNYTDAYNNLGSIYIQLDKLEQAEKLLLQTIALDPQYTKAYSNLGKLNHKLNNMNKAQEYYKKSLLIDPNNVDAKFSLSLAYLAAKDYANGWNFYRYRYHVDRKEKKIPLYEPKTLLQSIDELADKTLFITIEQGLGDIIQTIRLIPLLLEQKAKIVCKVPTSLMKILVLNYPMIDFIEDTTNISFDYNVPIMDLFYILDIKYNNIPYSSKYLSINTNDSLNSKTQYDLDKNKFKIAINYQGNHDHTNDHNRSIALEKLLEYLYSINEIELYSLQYERTEEEDKMLEEYNVINLGKEAKDFYDTACFIDNMDLIISVDTSVVHLSGAMGKSTFLLLPFSPDWRWGLNDNKTNWYDSITLFRQEEIGNWDEPLKKIVQTIEDLKLNQNNKEL